VLACLSDGDTVLALSHHLDRLVLLAAGPLIEASFHTRLSGR
jgi:hypothetical protein